MSEVIYHVVLIQFVFLGPAQYCVVIVFIVLFLCRPLVVRTEQLLIINLFSVLFMGCTKTGNPSYLFDT